MKIILIIIWLIIITLPIYAVDGYVSIEYSLTTNTYLTEINLIQKIERFTVGLNMQTEVSQINLKGGWLPAGEPINQRYTGYIQYVYKKITFTLLSSCLHYFSHYKKTYEYDESDIKFKIKYEF